MFLPRGNDGLWFLLDDVVQDRQIVRCKVPRHIYVVLEETQIHSRRVIVVEIPQSTVIHQLPDFPHCAGEEKGFSTKTCFPFCRAAFASSKCVQTGVTTAMASICVEVRSSEQSAVSSTPGKACLARRRVAGTLSEMATTSQFSSPRRFLATFGPQ